MKPHEQTAVKRACIFAKLSEVSHMRAASRYFLGATERQVVHILEMESSWTKRVLRWPSLMVPPMCVLDTSGMNTTTGCSVFSSNSVELASVQPSTLRAYSITATCTQEK